MLDSRLRGDDKIPLPLCGTDPWKGGELKKPKLEALATLKI